MAHTHRGCCANRSSRLFMSAFLFSCRTALRSTLISLLATSAWSLQAQTAAAPPTELEKIVVERRSADLIGTASASSQGSVGYVELDARPFLRRGELLEVIPGVVITQHSGGGKANQYFLRGFN